MNVLDQFSLKTKVAIVTGGEGLLGRAICETIRELGGTAISLDVKPTAEQVVDITDNKAVVALGESAPRIDILVNCAVNKGHSAYAGGVTLCLKNHFGTYQPDHSPSDASVPTNYLAMNKSK